MSDQPPGGGDIAPSGAVESKSSERPSSSTTKRALSSTTAWLSTTSRPGGLSVPLPRIGSPPQPPPLPPPPPSPQLVPLKARLARSKSAASHSTGRRSIGVADQANRGNWDAPSAQSRRTAFRQGPSRSLKEDGRDEEDESTVSFIRDGKSNLQPDALLLNPTTETVPTVKHPSEQNIFTVCAASLVFLSLSIVITAVFTAVVLPFCILAFCFRRLGAFTANAFPQLVCCQCNRPQPRVHPTNLFVGIISRLLVRTTMSDQICQCLSREITQYGTLRLLTPAELRWLPALKDDADPIHLPLHLPLDSPFIIICLRFGSPGIRLDILRELLASRLLARCSAHTSPSPSYHGSLTDEKRSPSDHRQRAHSVVPPMDTLARLTQCLTCFSMGYAWRECPAFRLEDHVTTVPTEYLKSARWNSRLVSPFKQDRQNTKPLTVDVESVIDAVSKSPMVLNRPLWQAFLLEQYQEIEGAESSDQESVTESDDCGTGRGGMKQSPSKGRFLGSGGESKKNRISPSFIYQRSGSAGVGSLLIFRMHAALSDDGQALVRLLTSCLADSQVHRHRTSRKDRKSRRRWRGQPFDEPTVRTNVESSTNGNVNKTAGVNSDRTGVADKTSNIGSLDVNACELGYSKNSQPQMNRIGQELSSTTTVTSDDDPEESEAAQWWYTFWSSSVATVATCCDLIRAILTGPAIILHKYLFTQADMGLLVKRSVKQLNRGPSTVGQTRIHKCALLSLVKLSRVSQVTKTSYSEIILSLLAGALRAYHQTVGLQHPPDLVSFLSVEVPKLPSCSLNGTQNEVNNPTAGSSCEVTPCPGISGLLTSPTVRRVQNRAQSRNASNGIGNNNNNEYLIPTYKRDTTLQPGRYVLTDICLPINTEGVLPRLWETRQRLLELKNSVDPLCLAWARTFLYVSLPHPLATHIEATLGSSAKASVCVTGIDVVSPFGRHGSTASETEPGQTYLMPPNRRLAYMSLLASKSAEARSYRKRIRRRFAYGPPRQGTSFRALAKHLANANAGLVYIAGAPVVRVDTWMPSPHVSETVLEDKRMAKSQWRISRDLSVTFTTYAGQLSITFSIGSDKYEGCPDIDLILKAMRTQLRTLCTLLAGRHPMDSTGRWLSHSLMMEPNEATTSVINLSPSLNPSVVLRPDPTDSKSVDAMSSASSSCSRRGQVSGGNESWAARRLSSDAAKQGKPKQPIEQLQDRLAWVQQQLIRASSDDASDQLTTEQLASLRAEFSSLLRLLKQRCSLGSLKLDSDILKRYAASYGGSISDKDAHQTSNLDLIHDSKLRQSKTETSSSLLSSVTEASVSYTLAGGDFDEDPDFFIDSSEEEEYAFEEALNRKSSSSDSDSTPDDEQSTANTIKPTVGSKRKLSDLITKHWNKSKLGQGDSLGYSRPDKRRHTKHSKRSAIRRHSLLSSDVSSFDLRPTRRGSLRIGRSAPRGRSVKLFKRSSVKVDVTKKS